MPLYEFVMRAPGRPDEVRISDYNGVRVGDEIDVASHRWVVAGLEHAAKKRSDGLPVAQRIVMVRAADTEAA